MRRLSEAAERLDHGFGFGDEPPHELARGHEFVDGARALTRGVALAVGVDAGGLVAARGAGRPPRLPSCSGNGNSSSGCCS